MCEAASGLQFMEEFHMSVRLPITCLSLVVVTCGLFQYAAADPLLPMRVVPVAPPGYLLVDEEMWSQLMDETGRHLDRARDSYLHGHLRTAAQELHKASIMMRIDAAHGEDRADIAMIKAAHELERLAHRLQSPQSMDTIDDIDVASAKALTALADHEHIKAEMAWKQGHGRRSGRYLRSAADNLERAAFRARVAVSVATSDAVRDARILSGRLVDGVGYAMDEVGSGIHAFGHQIRHFTSEVVRPMNDRR